MYQLPQESNDRFCEISPKASTSITLPSWKVQEKTKVQSPRGPQGQARASSTWLGVNDRFDLSKRPRRLGLRQLLIQNFHGADTDITGMWLYASPYSWFRVRHSSSGSYSLNPQCQNPLVSSLVPLGGMYFPRHPTELNRDNRVLRRDSFSSKTGEKGLQKVAMTPFDARHQRVPDTQQRTLRVGISDDTHREEALRISLKYIAIQNVFQMTCLEVYKKIHAFLNGDESSSIAINDCRTPRPPLSPRLLATRPEGRIHPTPSVTREFSRHFPPTGHKS